MALDIRTLVDIAETHPELTADELRSQIAMLGADAKQLQENKRIRDRRFAAASLCFGIARQPAIAIKSET